MSTLKFSVTAPHVFWNAAKVDSGVYVDVALFTQNYS